MDQADFVHMVRMSEIASAENSSAYRRSVAAFAALGYAWVLGCLVLALGMALWPSCPWCSAAVLAAANCPTWVSGPLGAAAAVLGAGCTIHTNCPPKRAKPNCPSAWALTPIQLCSVISAGLKGAEAGSDFCGAACQPCSR